MTTPRPPRSNPPRRTPKVAGRTPARPGTSSVSETTPEQTTAEQATPEQATPEQTGPPRKSRFSRRPKSAPPVAATPPAPASDDTTAESAAVEPPVGDASAPGAPATPTDEVVVETTGEADVDTPAATPSDAAGTEPAIEPTATDEPATTSLQKSPAASTDGPRGKSRPTTKVSTIKPQSRRPSARPAVPAGTTDPAPRRPLPGWKFVGIVAAAAVILAIVAGIAVIKPGVSLASNGAFVDSAVTSEVTSQANARVCTIFGIQYDKLDQWEQVARSNVTGVAAGNFDRYSKAVRDTLGQTGVTSGGADCRVDAIGVRSIDGDDAVLLANLIISTTQDGQAGGSEVKRYQVSMHRVAGKWLISDFIDF